MGIPLVSFIGSTTFPTIIISSPKLSLFVGQDTKIPPQSAVNKCGSQTNALHDNPEVEPDDYSKARAALQDVLDSDKALASEIDDLYSGAKRDGAAKLRFSVETYDKFIAGFFDA